MEILNTTNQPIVTPLHFWPYAFWQTSVATLFINLIIENYGWLYFCGLPIFVEGLIH